MELIKRGKAGKEIEFGHMVNFQQVKEKFITGYDVFERKPVEHAPAFKLAQKFRAGIEGSIVFAHNLLILARS